MLWLHEPTFLSFIGPGPFFFLLNIWVNPALSNSRVKMKPLKIYYLLFNEFNESWSCASQRSVTVTNARNSQPLKKISIFWSID